jgi:hypothetical protein
MQEQTIFDPNILLMFWGVFGWVWFNINKIVINAISADHFVIKDEPVFIPHICLQESVSFFSTRR